MTPQKRCFDLAAALVLGIVLAPVIAVVALVIALREGRPVFHVSERMRSPDEGFGLIKFRTMLDAPGDRGVSGGDKDARITKLGRFLRRTNLDELPQLWNVLRGDISFVGPRPPLREYVERFPETYAQVLKSRPGITGLASIHFQAHERRLLARSRDATETDAIYCRACIPRKARLDLIYQARTSLCFDLVLMVRTVFGRRRGGAAISR